MTSVATLRSISLLICASLTAACGGGSDSGPPTESFSVSTTQMNFTADLDGAQPPTQAVSGTASNVNESVRVDVVITGTAVQTASFAMTGTHTGALHVLVKAPDVLRVGTHTSQITVSVCKDLVGCTNNPNQIPGSPKTINVTYAVTATPTVRYVAPAVVQPGALSDVIIRGVGFSLLSSPSVNVGSARALSTTYVNDTEIRATLPALAAGSFPVSLSTASGATATEASLHVLTEPALGYAFIPSVGGKSRVLYDARRDAIYVGNVATGQLIRYAHSVDPADQKQVWTPTMLALPSIRDISMLPDGNTLLVVSNQNVVHVNLDTFNAQATVPSPFTGSGGGSAFIHNLPVANNGIAYAVSNINGFGATFLYRYDSRKRSFKLDRGGVSQGAGAAAGDGSKIFIASNMPDGVYQYDATADVDVALTSMHAQGANMLADKTGNTLFFDSYGFRTAPRVIVRNSVSVGALVHSSTNYVDLASALTSNGNTLYSYSSGSRVIDVYDLTTSDGAGGFNQKPSIPLSGLDSVGDNVMRLMGLSPFERTLFVVGIEGILVQPLP